MVVLGLRCIFAAVSLLLSYISSPFPPGVHASLWLLHTSSSLHPKSSAYSLKLLVLSQTSLRSLADNLSRARSLRLCVCVLPHTCYKVGTTLPTFSRRGGSFVGPKRALLGVGVTGLGLARGCQEFLFMSGDFCERLTRVNVAMDPIKQIHTLSRSVFVSCPAVLESECLFCVRQFLLCKDGFNKLIL